MTQTRHQPAHRRKGPIMPLFNAAQSVVALIDAPDAETAMEILNERLRGADFDVYGHSIEPGAFESEDQPTTERKNEDVEVTP